MPRRKSQGLPRGSANDPFAERTAEPTTDRSPDEATRSLRQLLGDPLDWISDDGVDLLSGTDLAMVPDPRPDPAPMSCRNNVLRRHLRRSRRK
jgi:hypothetical protein